MSAVLYIIQTILYIVMSETNVEKLNREKEQWLKERKELYSNIDMEFAEIESFIIKFLKKAEKEGKTVFVGDLADAVNGEFSTGFTPRKIGVILHDNLNVRRKIIREGKRTGRAIISRKQMIMPTKKEKTDPVKDKSDKDPSGGSEKRS